MARPFGPFMPIGKTDLGRLAFIQAIGLTFHNAPSYHQPVRGGGSPNGS